MLYHPLPYASFEEDAKGRLEPGKLSDMLILSNTVIGKSAKDIYNTRVVQTIMDGLDTYKDTWKDFA